MNTNPEDTRNLMRAHLNHGQINTDEKSSVSVHRMSLVFMAALVLALNLVFASAASAAITVVSYWHMGEFDPGASAGIAATNTIDTAGSRNLKFSGQAFYSNDVAGAALAHVGSSR